MDTEILQDANRICKRQPPQMQLDTEAHQLARCRLALHKHADFLVLDEAASDPDSNLEREVQDSIEAMDRDYGIIAIAHRLSTVQNADRIYTVDAGEIVESGHHRELLGNEGIYSELYATQSH